MQTHDILLTIFTGILAVAVLAQTLIFFGLLQAIRRLSAKVDEMSGGVLRSVDAVSLKVQETLAPLREIAGGFVPVKDRIVDTAEMLHARAVEVDAFLGETTSTVRQDILRMQDGFLAASDQVQKMLEDTRGSIMAPVHEITAIARGIQAGFHFLLRRRRRASEIPDQDEEMFI